MSDGNLFRSIIFLIYRNSKQVTRHPHGCITTQSSPTFRERKDEFVSSLSDPPLQEFELARKINRSDRSLPFSTVDFSGPLPREIA